MALAAPPRPASRSAPRIPVRPRWHPNSHRQHNRLRGRTCIGSYSWARYYHPTPERFVSEDPIGFLAGPGFCAYANDPMRFKDPLGLDTYGIGVQGSAGLGKGGSLTVGVVWDDSCRVGIGVTVGGGGFGGAGWSIIGQGQWTTANNFSGLSGWGADTSVTGGAGIVGGGQFITGSGGYMGGSGGIGVGGRIGLFGTPVTIGGEATYTWVFPLGKPCGVRRKEPFNPPFLTP